MAQICPVKKNAPQVERQLRKDTKVHVYAQCFSLSFQAWEGLLKFDTTAWIQLSPSVKALSLRGDPWRLNKGEHSPSWNGTYGDTGFTVPKLAILTSIKVRTFAKDEMYDLKTTANLIYDQKC